MPFAYTGWHDLDDDVIPSFSEAYKRCTEFPSFNEEEARAPEKEGITPSSPATRPTD